MSYETKIGSLVRAAKFDWDIEWSFDWGFEWSFDWGAVCVVFEDELESLDGGGSGDVFVPLTSCFVRGRW